MPTPDEPRDWRQLARETLRSDERTAWPDRRTMLADALLGLLLTAAVLYAGTFASIGRRSLDSQDGPLPYSCPAQELCHALPGPSVPVPLEPREYALLALTALPLVARRRYPLAVFWAVQIAALDTQAYGSWLSVLGCAVAARSAVAHSRNLPPVLGSFALGAVLAATVLDRSAEAAWPLITRPYVILNVVALIAAVVRHSRQTLTASQQRLAEVRSAQQAATALAVAEERARIAAELHDVVTHNVSVMVIQAGAARRVLDSSPDLAREAMLAVESGGRAAMAELRHVMGLLAASGTGRAADGSPDELEPQPGLDQLAALAARVGAAGLPVTLALSLPPEPLPSGVDLTAYRVVQEALTNALKHAVGAQVSVTIGHDEQWLRIEVADTGGTRSPQAATGGGRGLIGLRERLALYGGSLDAGRRIGGGYLIEARLHRRTG
ncbi:histidine kinase [Kitasatospora sp. NBC_01287]|uniref:sensor histidine kinase n=1 Tax=Kitasatospora sp. NBC_01287 TaxID=2903573 RepID=UPI002250278B|nr:histidine kinase [Kitasatospora sp. NBC_01287]MCX4747890.1 histidine kinase [Kitasatospora sp. NBC_01287]